MNFLFSFQGKRWRHGTVHQLLSLHFQQDLWLEGVVEERVVPQECVLGIVDYNLQVIQIKNSQGVRRPLN